MADGSARSPIEQCNHDDVFSIVLSSTVPYCTVNVHVHVRVHVHVEYKWSTRTIQVQVQVQVQYITVQTVLDSTGAIVAEATFIDSINDHNDSELTREVCLRRRRFALSPVRHFFGRQGDAQFFVDAHFFGRQAC